MTQRVNEAVSKAREFSARAIKADTWDDVERSANRSKKFNTAALAAGTLIAGVVAYKLPDVTDYITSSSGRGEYDPISPYLLGESSSSAVNELLQPDTITSITDISSSVADSSAANLIADIPSTVDMSGGFDLPDGSIMQSEAGYTTSASRSMDSIWASAEAIAELNGIDDVSKVNELKEYQKDILNGDTMLMQGQQLVWPRSDVARILGVPIAQIP